MLVNCATGGIGSAAAQLLSATGVTVTAVCAAVGKRQFARCHRILKPAGVYVSSEPGPGWQNLALAIVGSMRRGRRRVVFPFLDDDQLIVEEIQGHLTSGAFRPVIDRTTG